MTPRPLLRLWRLPDVLPPLPRLAAGAGGLALAVVLVNESVALGVLTMLVGLHLLWDGVRQAGVWRAFAAFRRGDLAAMRRELGRTRWPRLLSVTARSYYNWLRGASAAADGRFAAARVHLLVAAAGRLRTETDRALVQCLLAESALREDDTAAAREHLALARRLSRQPRVQKMVEGLASRVPAGPDKGHSW